MAFNRPLLQCVQVSPLLLRGGVVEYPVPCRSAMQFLYKYISESGPACYDNQYRATHHGSEQRYVSPTTGRCRRLIVQAVHPKPGHFEYTEVAVGAHIPKARKLAIWLVCNPPFNPLKIPLWLVRWARFTLALICHLTHRSTPDSIIPTCQNTMVISGLLVPPTIILCEKRN